MHVCFEQGMKSLVHPASSGDQEGRDTALLPSPPPHPPHSQAFLPQEEECALDLASAQLGPRRGDYRYRYFHKHHCKKKKKEPETPVKSWLYSLKLNVGDLNYNGLWRHNSQTISSDNI